MQTVSLRQASAFLHFGRTYRSSKMSNISRSVLGKYSSPVERSANLPESNLRFLLKGSVSTTSRYRSEWTYISFSAYRLNENRSNERDYGQDTADTYLRSRSNIMLPDHPSTANAYLAFGDMIKSTLRVKRRCTVPVPSSDGFGGSRNRTNALSRPSKLLCSWNWCEAAVSSVTSCQRDRGNWETGLTQDVRHDAWTRSACTADNPSYTHRDPPSGYKDPSKVPLRRPHHPADK